MAAPLYPFVVHTQHSASVAMPDHLVRCSKGQKSWIFLYLDLKHTYGHRLRVAGVGFEDRKVLGQVFLHVESKRHSEEEVRHDPADDNGWVAIVRVGLRNGRNCRVHDDPRHDSER